jgi:hypothetical protein
MVSLIKKKQRKKGLDIDLDLASTVDPFVEIDRYLSQPCLRREDCPNPIPWWGVSIFVYIALLVQLIYAILASD